MTDDAESRPRDDGRNLSSPVPYGPSSEPGAMSGTGAAAPSRVMPTQGEDVAVPAEPAGPTAVEPASDLAEQSSHRRS